MKRNPNNVVLFELFNDSQQYNDRGVNNLLQ